MESTEDQSTNLVDVITEDQMSPQPQEITLEEQPVEQKLETSDDIIEKIDEKIDEIPDMPDSADDLSDDDDEQLGEKPSREKKLERALQKVEKNEFNVEAWMSILNEVKHMNLEEARQTYEKFLSKFPTASKYWKNYVDLEISTENYSNVDTIFSRCLLENLNVELWQSYLSYVKRTKNPQDHRDEIEAAYEFTLQHIGLDINAAPIWNEYLVFLKSQKYQSQFDTTQQMVKIRRVYQRAISNPMNGIDHLLKDYEIFENEVSPLLAKGLVHEVSQKYKLSVTRLMERKKLRDGLLPSNLATPYHATSREDHQLQIWKTLISTEIRNYRSGPDAKRHISFVFKQALLCLYHYPEIWYMYAQYYVENGMWEDAASIYEDAIKALPTNATIWLFYAYFEETRKNLEKVKTLYDQLIERKSDPIVWIQFMKFANRNPTCGTTAGKIFLQAKKANAATYQVYLAIAQLEWEQNNKPDIAKRLFEIGLKEFLTQPVYVNEYLRFLESLNDKSNIRLIFEKVVDAMPKPKSLEFWNKFVDFEVRNGDKDTIAKVSKRRAEAYPEYEMSEYQYMMNQFHFLDLFLEGNINKKSIDVTPQVQFVRPDFSQMTKIDTRNMNFIRKDGSLPDAIERLMNYLPKNYDGPVPDIEYVMETLVKNELPLMETFEEGGGTYESDEENSLKQGGDEGDLWLRQQKKKRKFSGKK